MAKLIAGHDDDGAKFEAFSEVHGADGEVAGGGEDVFVEDFGVEAGGFGGEEGAREFGGRADEDADFVRRNALFGAGSEPGFDDLYFGGLRGGDLNLRRWSVEDGDGASALFGVARDQEATGRLYFHTLMYSSPGVPDSALHYYCRSERVYDVCMDFVSPEVRSQMMASVRSTNTNPERIVRSCAHDLGLRFRLHCCGLPGRPDIVFRRHDTVIFVHGCFWHRHSCRRATVPKTRTAFWVAKFADNQKRDREVRALLESLGWRVIEIWECETADRAALRRKLSRLFRRI